MKLAIHGTNNSYRILYTNDEEFARIVAKDIRKSALGDAQLGSYAYALFLINGTCVFTKYVIIKDSLRSFATGTFAISVGLERGEKIRPKEIYNILNELYSAYANNHIKDNCLNNGESIPRNEDWSFVNTILDGYKSTTEAIPYDTLSSGTQDAAIIYYDNIEELFRYMASPFQPEYSDYIQIYFIDIKFQGPADPIHVLRNSGKILDVDFNNELCYVSNYDKSKGVKIHANKKEVSEQNSKIWSKDKIEIYFLKDPDCFKPIHQKGFLSDTKIGKYIHVDNRIARIRYEAFENPKPIEKKIHFQVRGNNNNLKGPFQYKLDNQNQKESKESLFSEEFKGEQLKQTFTIECRSGEYNGEAKFTPCKDAHVDIVLRRRKRIKLLIDVKYKDYHSINKYEIEAPKVDDIVRIDSNTFEFIDEAITRKSLFIISAVGYENKLLEIIANNLKEKFEETIILNRSKRYKVDATELGWSNQVYTYNKSGSDVEIYPKSRKYKYTHLILDLDSKSIDYDGTLVAQYIKKSVIERNKSWVVVGAVIFALIVGGIFIFEIIDSKIDSKEEVNHNVPTSNGTRQSAGTTEKLSETTQQTQETRDTPMTLASAGNQFDNSEGKTDKNSKEGDKQEAASSGEAKGPSQGKNGINEEKSRKKPREFDKEELKLLKSDQVTRSNLEEWKKVKRDTVALILYLEFWAKITSDTQEDFKRLHKKVLRDNYLKESELETYLNQLESSEEKFEIFKEIENRARKSSLRELKIAK